MLTKLIIKNFLLFEEVSISFGGGFTVITGESGSGKTAIIDALSLILGERADFTKVRKESSSAQIEAHFEGPFSQGFLDCLEEASIEFFPEETLSLKREIHISGKTKAFVNQHLVTCSFLQTITPHLLDFVAQHHALLLKQNSYQRECLDQFGKIDLLPFSLRFKQEQKLKAQIGLLENKLEIEKTKKEQREYQLAEIRDAAIQKEDEEGALAEQHRLLTKQEELALLTRDLLGETEQIEFAFSRLFSLLEKMEKREEVIASAYAHFKEAKILFSEGLYEIEKRKEQWEINPLEVAAIEKRLATLHMLRKKYGKDPFLYQIELEKELSSLDSLEEDLAALLKTHSGLEEELDQEAFYLSEQRKKAAISLSEQMTSLVQKLHMPQAQLFFACTPESRSSYGEDKIELYLQANPGEKATTARDGCSGGELSRLLFALKCLLAQSSSFSSMIFDEIDANIGGETATSMGQAIAVLGKQRQILCITHFPQVAVWADHHLQVYKEEIGGRTLAQIRILTLEEKEEEKMRMQGGSSCLSL